MLGTGSIVLTLGFSYTTTVNIEEAMKNSGDIKKIKVQKAEYKPKQQNSLLNSKSSEASEPDFGPALVKKLSTVPGVDFVFPRDSFYLWGDGVICFGDNFIWMDSILGLDFSKPENLNKAGFSVLPGGKFRKNAKGSKFKNVVVGCLFDYEFCNVKGKNWREFSNGSALWDFLKERKGKGVAPKPFVNIEKTNQMQLLIPNFSGRKQMKKILDKMFERIWNEGGQSYEDDEQDEKENNETVEIATVSKFSDVLGKKFNINITGMLDFDGFNPKIQNWEVLASIYDDWDKREFMTSVVVDLETLRELKDLLSEGEMDKAKSKKDKYAYKEIDVYARDWENVGGIVDVIQNQLNYRTSSLLGDIKEKQKQSAGLRAMLGALGVITVVVSALGIANMMFMSISERTREIGIMKVLGCKINTIRIMFLTEAGIVGLLGGILGVVGSWGVAKGLSKVVQIVSSAEFLEKARDNELFAKVSEGVNNFANMFNLIEGKDVIMLPFVLIWGGILFGTLVGLVSGFAPANRAVKISALSAIKSD
jgi:ABC-type antimicrobial peptide transport system permease subunit